MRRGQKIRKNHRAAGLFALGLAAAVALAGAQLPLGAMAPAQAANAANCRVTKVTDGDTLHIDCGHGDHRVRLMGYDTPETYGNLPKCPAEKMAGEAETRMMKTLVASGPVTGLRFVKHDRYGRDLDYVEIGGRDVSKTMLTTPWARPYTGHKKPDWCGIIAREHLPESAFRQATLKLGG